jgi:hypothetical protein
MLIDDVIQVTITHRRGEGESSVAHHIRFEMAAKLFLAHREAVERAVETGFQSMERYLKSKTGMHGSDLTAEQITSLLFVKFKGRLPPCTCVPIGESDHPDNTQCPRHGAIVCRICGACYCREQM